jgi:hypothetical protein
MKRWYWLPAALLLAFSACDDKDAKSGPVRRSSAPAAASAPSPSNAPDSREPDVSMISALQYADAGNAPSDEAAAASGDRYFDGAALRNAGFAVPGGDASTVYAGGGGSRRPRLSYTRAASRGSKGLAAAEPPFPDSAEFAPGSEASAAGAGKVLAAFDGFQRRMFEAAEPILSRAGWRAAKRKGSPVAMTPTHVTVHHTDGAQTMTEAATAAEVRNIQHYHMAGRAKEGKDVWEDIGYHFLIDGAGRVVEGRPAETLGAHVRGANENNIGIAMMGNFERIKPTADQVASLTRLVSFLALKYRQDPSRKGFLEGHRHYNSTDCPGKNMMAILDGIRARIDAETVELAARVKAAPKGQFVPVLTHA